MRLAARRQMDEDGENAGSVNITGPVFLSGCRHAPVPAATRAQAPARSTERIQSRYPRACGLPSAGAQAASSCSASGR